MFCMFNIFTLMALIMTFCHLLFSVSLLLENLAQLCLLIICSLLSLEIIALFHKDNNYYKILMVRSLVRQSDSGFIQTDWYL